MIDFAKDLGVDESMFGIGFGVRNDFDRFGHCLFVATTDLESEGTGIYLRHGSGQFCWQRWKGAAFEGLFEAFHEELSRIRIRGVVEELSTEEQVFAFARGCVTSHELGQNVLSDHGETPDFTFGKPFRDCL